MRKPEVVLAVVWCLGVAIVANAGDKPSLLERIQGPWGVCQLSVAGVQFPVGEPPNGFTMRVDGAELRYSFLVDQRPTDIRFFLTTSPDQPHEIDARILSGQWTGRVVKGLAELKGDTLRICLADQPELERPKKIDPKAPGQYFVLKRLPTDRETPEK